MRVPCGTAQNNKVGAIATLYTASYHGNQPYVAPAAQDTWVPVDAVSQAFCVGATVTYLGEAFEWGGDNECVGARRAVSCCICKPLSCIQQAAARQRSSARQPYMPPWAHAWARAPCACCCAVWHLPMAPGLGTPLIGRHAESCLSTAPEPGTACPRPVLHVPRRSPAGLGRLAHACGERACLQRGLP